MRNPNKGKKHAARLSQRLNRTYAQVEKVRETYRPGMTLAARAKGRARMEDRIIAATVAWYAGHVPTGEYASRRMRGRSVAHLV